jgi:hypothetical protein
VAAGEFGCGLLPHQGVGLAPVAEVTQTKVAGPTGPHTQRDEVARIELPGRIEMERVNVVDLPQ